MKKMKKKIRRQFRSRIYLKFRFCEVFYLIHMLLIAQLYIEMGSMNFFAKANGSLALKLSLWVSSTNGRRKNEK